MPLFSFHKLIHEPIKKPSFEPKRVIHPPKISFDASTNSQQPGTEGPIKEGVSSTQPEPANSIKSENPGRRLRNLVKSGMNLPSYPATDKTHSSSRWDRIVLVVLIFALGVSLIANILLWFNMKRVNEQTDTLRTTVSGLLSNLYGNIDEVNNNSLTTNITVDTQVPLSFMLPIQQNTDIILTDSVYIQHAYVVINSGGLTINAPASITLPAGTNLPVSMNMAIPVQVNIPLTLQIPVEIPIGQTELSQSVSSIQDTIRTYACRFDQNAQYPQGIYLCESHETLTATPTNP
jgi:hypothetical protein